MNFKFDLQLFAAVTITDTSTAAVWDTAVGTWTPVSDTATAITVASVIAYYDGSTYWVKTNLVDVSGLTSAKVQGATFSDPTAGSLAGSIVATAAAGVGIGFDTTPTIKITPSDASGVVGVNAGKVTSLSGNGTFATAGGAINFANCSGGKIDGSTAGTYTLESFTGVINAGNVTGITSGTLTTNSTFSGTVMSEAFTKDNVFGVTTVSGDTVYTVKAVGNSQTYLVGKNGTSNWSIVGSATADTFTTNAANAVLVTLEGGEGGDTFTLGGAGKTYVDGGAGGDKVSVGAALADGSSIIGGAGDDSVDIAVAAALGTGILFDLGDGNDTLTASKVGPLGNNTTILGGAGKDTLDLSGLGGTGSIELYIDGGSDADKIVGDGAITNSTVVGGDGNDTIGGFTKTTTLEGGDGSDYFDLGAAATDESNIKDYKFGEDYLAITTGATAVADANNLATGADGSLGKDGAYGFINKSTANGAATITSSAGFFAATMVDTAGNKVNVGWVGESPVTLDARDQKIDSVITGRTNSGGDLVYGSQKTDTIYAGNNDSVYGAEGSDTIDATGMTGVYVGLSTAGGADEVKGFATGWDAETADTVYLMDGTAEDLKVINNGTDVSLKSGSATMKLTNQGNAADAKVLISGKKVDVLAKNYQVKVTDDSTIADYYVGTEASGINMEDYTGDVEVNLSDERFRNISTIQAGKGNMSVLGGKAAESLVGGKGATSLYGGAGVDTLKSGDGKTTFFANESSGKDVVTGFVVGTDDNSDVINVNNLKSLSRADNTNFTVDLDGTNSLKVAQKSGDINSNIQWVSGDAKGVVKIGKTAADNKFSYDAATTNYYGSSKTDVVSVASGAADNFEVWLDQTGDMFISVEGYDFSQTSGNVLAAGKNGVAETLVAGKGNSSLWGGTGSTKDVLVNKNSSATAEFFYGMGDGNDEIQGQKGDSVNLYNLNVSDITQATINSNNVVFTTVAKETVTVSGGVGTFKLADGSSWTADYSKKTWTQN